MSTPVIALLGTPVTLESSGSSITSGSVVAASTSYDIVANGSSYPHGQFGLSFTFGTAPADGTQLALMAAPKKVDGTTGHDAPAPTAARPDRMIGTFFAKNVTTLQYAECEAFNLPPNATYYLYNVSTSQTVSSGWTLTVTPLTRGT